MSAHRLFKDMFLEGAPQDIVDPGDAASITVDKQFGKVQLVSAAAETRTLPVPQRDGLYLGLHMKTDGGAITLTVTSGYDTAGTTTLTFNDAGDFVVFYSVQTAATTFRWRVVGSNSVAVAQTEDIALTSTSEITGAGTTVAPLIPLGTPQSLSGAGAVTITQYQTKVTNTGSDALTLADGAQLNQLKRVEMIVDPGTDSTLTPANFTDGSTITFADVGDFVVLAWDGTGWTVIESGNTVDGVTFPATA